MNRKIRAYKTDSKIYVLGLDQETKKKSGMVNLLYVTAIAILQLLAGMVNQPSSRTFWVVYPYLIRFLPLGYAVWGVFTYIKSTTRMSSTQYHEGLLRIRKSLLALLVLAVMSVGLELIYIGLHHADGGMESELLYIAIHVPIILGVIAYGKYYDRHFTNITVES